MFHRCLSSSLCVSSVARTPSRLRRPRSSSNGTEERQRRAGGGARRRRRRKRKRRRPGKLQPAERVLTTRLSGLSSAAAVADPAAAAAVAVAAASAAASTSSSSSSSCMLLARARAAAVRFVRRADFWSTAAAPRVGACHSPFGYKYRRAAREAVRTRRSSSGSQSCRVRLTVLRR